MMEDYHQLTLAQILPNFYKEYNLGADGGIHLNFVKLEFGSYFNFYIPNWDARRKAVLRHDIHHIITGYRSDLLGETEIAAWEISSGCTKYYPAYLLNSLGLLMGITLNPVKMIQAFIKGSKTKNLYNLSYTDDQLKNKTILALQNELLLSNDHPTKMNFTQFIRLIFHLIMSVIIHFLFILILPFLLIFHLYYFINKPIVH